MQYVEIQKLEKKSTEHAQINSIPLAGNEQCTNTNCAYGKIWSIVEIVENLIA